MLNQLKDNLFKTKLCLSAYQKQGFHRFPDFNEEKSKNRFYMCGKNFKILRRKVYQWLKNRENEPINIQNKKI